MNKFVDFFFPKTKGDKRSTKAFGAAAIILAVIVLINVLSGILNTNITQVDISGNRIYKVSDISKEVISGLDDDVDLIMVVNTEPDSRITKFIYGYTALSRHLNFSIVNPNDDPTILKKYECSAGQLIVNCEATGKFTAIDIYGSSKALMTVSTNNYTGNTVPNALDVDGQLTSAILQVTGEVSEKVYLMTGHGEVGIPDNAASFVVKNNIEISDSMINLLKNEGGIPDDCSVLICCNPTADLADDELKILDDYLHSGGNFMLLINASNFNNFNTLIKEYGLELQTGVVGDATNFYYNYINYYGYFCIFPELSTSSQISKNISTDAFLVYPFGMIETEPARDTISVDAFMTTSDAGLMYIEEDNVKTDTRFIIGAQATEEISDNVKSSFTVFSTAKLVDESITTTYPNMANIDIFINALTSNMGSIKAVSIPPTPLTTSRNTITGARPVSIILMYVLPLLIIVYGIVYCIRRKKR